MTETIIEVLKAQRTMARDFVKVLVSLKYKNKSEREKAGSKIRGYVQFSKRCSDLIGDDE